ncbi:MAG: phytanoyl-CoA dioxygenase family protein [Lentisphaeria bacterium]|nr:HEAT repeat domain-containing protein [Lentisphaeria bacterium]NQZ67444.1 phytanoyl-CoA dioxygenase family protein [Lentisphaeria bacterium]
MTIDQAPVLLTDEEIQRFICDGFLILKPNVDSSVHTLIDERFNWLVENEPNAGNNILPRLPELNQILNCAVVRGAMISLLGEDYLIHPHRYWHSRPPEKETMSETQIRDEIKRGSHQDAYTPAAQGKSHCLQFLRFMYYSHDMELANGPTHVVPGSQYHSSLTDEDRDRQIPVLGNAGTIFISHFDLAHAGCPNMSGRCRNMIKFLFLRAKPSPIPSWNHQDSSWKKPSNLQAPYNLENCWKKQWDLLCQNIKDTHDPSDATALISDLAKESELKSRISLIQKIGHSQSESAVEPLAALLNTAHQAERTTAIYALAEIGEAAIPALIKILEAAEQGLDKSVYNSTISLNDACYALSAIGESALDAVLPLLKVKKWWSLVNAIHVVNDCAVYRDDIRQALEDLLGNEKSFVVSFSINALGAIRSIKSSGKLFNILEGPRETVQTGDVKEWPEQWFHHYTIALAMARMGKELTEFEARIIPQLDHEFGQAAIMFTETLKRIGTPTALQAIVDDLSNRRWDAVLSEKRNF